MAEAAAQSCEWALGLECVFEYLIKIPEGSFSQSTT